MLENLSVEKLQNLLNTKGVVRKELSISETQIGDIVRIDTVSGNIYFFETVSANDCSALVFRCNPREFAPKSGLRGKRKISKISEGKQVFHDQSRTSAVKSIVLIRP